MPISQTLLRALGRLTEDGEGGGVAAGVPANNAGAGNIAGIGVGPKGEPGIDLRKKRKQFAEDGVTVTNEGAEEMMAQRMKSLKADGKEDTDEYRYLHKQVFEELSDEEIEKAAKAVHDNWMKVQKEAGHTEHKSPDGKEDYMAPYHKLSEPAKELDRGAVVAAATALGFHEETEMFAGAPVFTVDMDRVMNSRFGKHPRHRYSKYVGSDEVGESIRQHGRTRSSGDIILKDSATAVMTYLRRKAGRR